MRGERWRNMTLYLHLPDGAGKLEQLANMAGSEILPAPPHGLDEVPTGKALICVADMGSYEAAGYIISEQDFANWTTPGDQDQKTWLLIEQQAADELCPKLQTAGGTGLRQWPIVPRRPGTPTTSSR